MAKRVISSVVGPKPPVNKTMSLFLNKAPKTSLMVPSSGITTDSEKCIPIFESSWETRIVCLSWIMPLVSSDPMTIKLALVILRLLFLLDICIQEVKLFYQPISQNRFTDIDCNLCKKVNVVYVECIRVIFLTIDRY